jgi:acyl carrier protein
LNSIKALTTEQEEKLRESFKRYSPETLTSILSFRKEGNTNCVLNAVNGIIERYLPAEHAASLSQRPDSLRLVEDLGLDSLTMLEIIMSIEEALDFRIADNDARQIRTLGDVRRYVDDRVNNRPTHLAEIKHYDRDRLHLLLPQQNPFLFLDSAEIQGHNVRARYLFRGDEFFFAGHFRDNPVVPASIVSEALGQVGCLWILEMANQELEQPINITEMLFVGMEGLRFHKKVLPQEEIHLELRLTRLRPPLALFDGSVKVNGVTVARLESLTLAFGELLPEHTEKAESAPTLASTPAASLTATENPVPTT